MKTLILLAALVAANASATIVTFGYVTFRCSDGNDYAAFYDVTRGYIQRGLEPARRNLQAFCDKSLAVDEKFKSTERFFRVPHQCVADESPATLKCFEEFKSLRNDQGQGNQ